MRRTASLLSLVGLVLLLVIVLMVRRPGIPPTTPPPAEPPRPWVMGYHVGYLAQDLPTAEIPWDSLTHIVVGAAVPAADGSLDTTFHLGTQGSGWATGVVDAAHAHGREAVLMVGGAKSAPALRAATGDGSDRRILLDRILATVDEHGFDGVDLDWEPLARPDGPLLIDLARDIKAARPHLGLSVPLSPVNTNHPGDALHPFLPDLARVVDRINLMTYGMDADWPGWRSWHSSPLSGETPTTPMSVESTIRGYLDAGVPAARMGIGVGAFGTCVRGVNAPRAAASGLRRVGDDNSMSHRRIVRDYATPARLRWDDVAQVPYLTDRRPFGPLRCGYVSYEDPRSVAAKMTLARAHGLGGAMVWNLDLGHLPNTAVGGRDPHVDTVHRYLTR